MDLFLLFGWLVYGVIVGLVSKAIYKGEIPPGLFSTLAVGISGSFLGGFVRFLITSEGNPFQPSGLLMGVLGGIIACYIYKKFLK
jgi:uncharacterized membrane protein YeaQ/YmgE (transglycosylase-associated protein family)